MSVSDRERKIEEISKKLDETPAGQLAKTNFLAILELIPMVGGLFATLTNELIPDWKLGRLHKFAATLSVDLDDLKDRIDVEYLKREEFGYIFEKTFRAVLLYYQAEKLGALRNALLNSMLRTDVKQDVKEHLLGVIENLSTLHMGVLRVVDSGAPSTYGSGWETLRVTTMTELRTLLLRASLPDLDRDTIRAIWNELHNYGVFSVSFDEPILYRLHAPEESGLEAFLALGFRDVLSKFGKLLISFVKSPKSLET